MLFYDLRSYWNMVRTKIYNYFPNSSLNSLFSVKLSFSSNEMVAGWMREDAHYFI